MTIPALIKDLAVMLLTAGVITIIFKKIKQPLILGYILAGFLLSPYFPWFANIVDTESIETWSELGIIMLMFHLGLEFNLHKMAEVGGSAIITCLTETIGMIVIGYVTGALLGFTQMDSIILGAMLVMSSTTIIIKVFSELKIKEKFTESVFGILVVEDIVGIFMMVILSTVAVSKNVTGIAVASKLGLMLLYLVIWLILGIYLIPTFINRTVKYMTDEMLLVVSIGICLGMVLLADFLGFSTALGAFLAGSLIAGTVHVERVEKLTSGVKDMFGAVFFISVGMMANPAMIAKYWLEILIIIVVTLIGKLIFNTLGMLISGQNLKSAVETGFSLAQIGEFAFIIANLGYSLGVIDEFLYPIVVAVSVITTFTTPFLIKLAPKFANYLEKKLPEKTLNKLNRYTNEPQAKKDDEWGTYIKKTLLKTLIYGGIMFVVMSLIVKHMEPLLEGYGLTALVSKLISLGVIYLVMAFFIGPLIDRKNSLYTSLWLKKVSNRPPLIAFTVLRLLLAALICTIPLNKFFNPHPVLVVLIIACVVYLLTKISTKGQFATWYLHMETHFLRNFNERIIKNEEASGNKQKWLNESICIISFYARESDKFLDKTLRELSWGKNYSLYVVKIKRKDGTHIMLPSVTEKIYEGDKVYLIGSKKDLQNFYKLTKVVQTKPIRTIKEFFSGGYTKKETALDLLAIKVRGNEPFVGKTLSSSNFKENYKTIVIGIQKDGLPILMPNPSIRLSKGNILWMLGAYEDVFNMAKEYMEE